MTLNDITFAVRGAAFDVLRELGPGLLEHIYKHALAFELQARGLNVSMEVPVRVIYKDNPLDIGYRIDLLVEDCLLIEVKSVEALHPVHKKQLLTYLRLYDRKLGLLINFNVAKLEDKKSIIRIIN
ncbi:MAG TPA: GxxExxY protein [Ohtaekwangia sp.]|nr:GxxExxY protein [Ohtaekwangia sp.]